MQRQKIEDDAAVEVSRLELLTLQAENAAIESSGSAKAAAEARAESDRIRGESEVEQARLQARASAISSVSCVFK